MVVYTCDSCNREFHKKSTYIKHINRKTTCIESERNYNRLECIYCHKSYSRLDVLKRHQSKYCKIYALLGTILEELKFLREENQRIRLTIQNIQNNTT